MIHLIGAFSLKGTHSSGDLPPRSSEIPNIVLIEVVSPTHDSRRENTRISKLKSVTSAVSFRHL